MNFPILHQPASQSPTLLSLSLVRLPSPNRQNTHLDPPPPNPTRLDHAELTRPARLGPARCALTRPTK